MLGMFRTKRGARRYGLMIRSAEATFIYNKEIKIAQQQSSVFPNVTSEMDAEICIVSHHGTYRCRIGMDLTGAKLCHLQIGD